MEDVDPNPSDDGTPSETPPFFEKHDQYIDDLDTENLNQAQQHIETPHDNKINNNQECINKSLYQSITSPAEMTVENSKNTKKSKMNDGLIDKLKKAKKYLQEMAEYI